MTSYVNNRCTTCGRRGGSLRGVRGVVARYHWLCWTQVYGRGPHRALQYMWDLAPHLFPAREVGL